MKLCEQHASGLRDALCARGLELFMSNSEEECMRRLKSRMESGPMKSNFEPLTEAQMLIAYGSINMSTTDITRADHENGFVICPICYLDAQHREFCKNPACNQSCEIWIADAVEMVTISAMKLGLVAQA